MGFRPVEESETNGVLGEIVKCRCPHDLGDCDQAGDCPCHICHVSWKVRRALLEAAPERREPRSPVGLDIMVCKCGHTCDHHDDYGCLWTLCECLDLGERK